MVRAKILAHARPLFAVKMVTVVTVVTVVPVSGNLLQETPEVTSVAAKCMRSVSSSKTYAELQEGQTDA